MATLQVVEGAVAVQDHTLDASSAPVSLYSSTSHALLILRPLARGTDSGPKRRWPLPPELADWAPASDLIGTDHWDAVIVLRPLEALPAWRTAFAQAAPFAILLHAPAVTFEKRARIVQVTAPDGWPGFSAAPNAHRTQASSCCARTTCAW